jgi:hypothetical protein
MQEKHVTFADSKPLGPTVEVAPIYGMEELVVPMAYKIYFLANSSLHPVFYVSVQGSWKQLMCRFQK